MASRWKRRPLMLEMLEPRVYLSAGARDDRAAGNPAAERLRALVAQLFPSGLASTADVQAIDTASSTTSLLVVDVNGDADSSPALLAAFDRDTGELLGSVQLAEGQFVVVANSSASESVAHSPNEIAPSVSEQTSFDLVVLPQHSAANTPLLSGRLGAETAVDSPASVGIDRSSATTRDDSLKSLMVADDPVGDGDAENVPASRSPASDSPPVNTPVVVVFPTGSIPEDFNVRGAVQDGRTRASAENRDTARPLILSPTFPHWFTAMSPTPWWSRAVELPGVQSRVGDLLDRGLDDDYFGGRSRGGLGAGVGDSLRSIEFSNSRLMLRSPAQLMVFAAPATQEARSGGAGTELATYNFATGQLTRTGHSVSSRIFAAGGEVAFLSSEIEQGADLSGDGAMNALVLQVFNPVTGGVRNTGVSAERIRSEGGQLILGLRDAGKEATASPTLAATGKLWAYRFDPATGRLTNLLRPYDFPADTAAKVNRVELNSNAKLLIPDATLPISAGRAVDATVNPILLQGQTIAPIDSPPTRSSPIAIDASPRPPGGNPAGPPKPGGSSGDGSVTDSSSSAATSSSASAPAGAAAGGGGSGGE